MKRQDAELFYNEAYKKLGTLTIMTNIINSSSNVDEAIRIALFDSVYWETFNNVMKSLVDKQEENAIECTYLTTLALITYIEEKLRPDLVTKTEFEKGLKEVKKLPTEDSVSVITPFIKRKICQSIPINKNIKDQVWEGIMVLHQIKILST